MNKAMNKAPNSRFEAVTAMLREAAAFIPQQDTAAHPQPRNKTMKLYHAVAIEAAPGARHPFDSSAVAFVAREISKENKRALFEGYVTSIMHKRDNNHTDDALTYGDIRTDEK
jgi:hypothetical protein